MIRLVIAFLCAAAACMLVAGALSSAQTTANPTPDQFVTQVTHATQRDSFAGDMSANGRFVVIESNGDIATEKIATFDSSGNLNPNPRNNEDGNREIFLYDYAQRRIFQITNTKSVLKPAGSPSPTPSPSPSPSPSVSPSPTPFPSPTPVDSSNVAVEISNNRPMISLEPVPVGTQRTYTIVFSSNAPVTPASFDGTASAALSADGNQEIWTYQFTVTDNLVLSSGANVAPVDLTTGTFSRITDTPASRAPSPGALGLAPFIADDNRDATISDNGQIVAFISTRNLVPPGNVDTGAIPNPEVFLFNRASATFTQVTNTITTSQNFPIASSNPCLSSDGSVLAFASNANLTGNNDDGGGNGNSEIYVRDSGGLRQVTKTKTDTTGVTTGATVNVFTFGRRLSRDGKFIAFESLATDPGANGTNTTFYVSFVYSVTASTFAQLGPRPIVTAPDPVLHVPVFTDYNAALSPGSVMFTSAMNFKSDGTLPAAADASTGLNPANDSQIFIASLPVQSTGPFTRLTSVPSSAAFAGVGAIPSNSRQRLAFSRPLELGGGNPDASVEVFYQLTPTIVTESAGTLSVFTGASLIPVPVASPTASPSGSPSPSPSPSPTPTGSPTPFIGAGLGPGELAVAQSSDSLAPASATVSNADASEARRAPPLPIELNGVSVSISGAACGLYAVSATQIKFVVPIGLNTGTLPIVINNNGTVIRGLIQIVTAQPDIFTTTNGPLGRASVCNITNPAICSPEPFFVTTNDGTGTQVPTVLRVSLTGVRFSLASAIGVTVGTTSITPSNNVATDLPGSDQVDFILPSTVDTGDLPIVVSVGTATSRPTDTAAHITINAGASPNPNPIVATDFFVKQQYLDFLSRNPDSSGFAFWTNEINSCGSDAHCIEVKRINVSAAFFLSIEFQQTGYLVYRTYKAAYGNISTSIPVPVRFSEFLPDTQLIGQGVVVGQTGWEAALETNKQNFMNAFVQRSRFTTAFPTSLTAQQFVDKLYSNTGLAPASAQNRAAAINEFSSTTPADTAARARALRLVAEDAMLAQQEFNNAFVLIEYFGYLRRNPNDPPEQTLDFQGYSFWLNKLNSFNGNYINAEMVKAFLSSAEYQQRFGP